MEINSFENRINQVGYVDVDGVRYCRHGRDVGPTDRSRECQNECYKDPDRWSIGRNRRAVCRECGKFIGYLERKKDA